MKTEIRYKWRTRWAGKWSTTRYWCTEAEMLSRHPDAIRLDHTRQELQVPDSPGEAGDSGTLHTRLTEHRKG
jgi:hypothetical protein